MRYGIRRKPLVRCEQKRYSYPSTCKTSRPARSINHPPAVTGSSEDVIVMLTRPLRQLLPPTSTIRMSRIRYLTAKLAQQVTSMLLIRRVMQYLTVDRPSQLDDELMGAAGAFSLDQVQSSTSVSKAPGTDMRPCSWLQLMEVNFFPADFGDRRL